MGFKYGDSMKENQSCGTCKYWRKVKDSKGGECRASPPQMVTAPKGHKQEVVMGPKGPTTVSIPVYEIKGIFPLMVEDDPGCGHHVNAE